VPLRARQSRTAGAEAKTAASGGAE